MNDLIIAGHGYLSTTIIKLLEENNILGCKKIYALSRGNSKITTGSDLVTQIIIDFDKDFKSLNVKENSIVIYLAPPNTDSGPKDKRIRNFLKNVGGLHLKKFIYVSTSGVYGDCNGSMVNEQAVLKPLSERAKRRVDAETHIKKISIGNFPLVILRVPGIYGPRRLPNHEKLKTPMIQPEESKITNLIHVDDLANICLLACSDNIGNEIINVSDGCPLTTTEFYEEYCRQIKTTMLPYITLMQAKKIYSEKRLSFINESRRLDVTKMKILFNGYKCLNIREGIKKSLADSDG